MNNVEQKYIIMSNADEFYIIIHCTLGKLRYCTQTDKLNPNGSINIRDFADWLIAQHIRFRVQYHKVRNPIVRWMLKRDIISANASSAKHGLYITNAELNFLLTADKDSQNKLLWDSSDFT